jgi:hypothetical protein
MVCPGAIPLLVYKRKSQATICSVVLSTQQHLQLDCVELDMPFIGEESETMNCKRLLLLTTSSLVLFTLGCAHDNYYPPNGPPPPIAQVPPLVQVADRNGFQTGRSDGQRDAANGYPFEARRTRAYHETPGYDPNLGPLGAYRNAFRNAYLRGYDAGYNRR